MSIRLGNSCINCKEYNDGFCNLHETTVSMKHTCDSFEMKGQLKDDEDCTTCARFQTENCPNPEHAAAGMQFSKWAPREVA